ncbi:hypothetical protein LI951_10885 [Enterococcus sp. BWT-B8]|uniref:hypothetical protein n=1 Tax=unclassified Enterococcus TaxID=2608891 RepID=UPI001E58BE81|nr:MULTISPECIES: hypothetical protein [unclassified Enterococcus]MCB5952571.1 hypothetical protein [Enterococcus sp. BWT-B8]MCB5953387.1 hypothetical protein [Enterococcus sp. CWB-B31]
MYKEVFIELDNVTVGKIIEVTMKNKVVSKIVVGSMNMGGSFDDNGEALSRDETIDSQEHWIP